MDGVQLDICIINPRLGWLTAYDQTKLENLQEINIDIVQDRNNDHNLDLLFIY